MYKRWIIYILDTIILVLDTTTTTYIISSRLYEYMASVQDTHTKPTIKTAECDTARIRGVRVVSLVTATGVGGDTDMVSILRIVPHRRRAPFGCVDGTQSWKCWGCWHGLTVLEESGYIHTYIHAHITIHAQPYMHAYMHNHTYAQSMHVQSMHAQSMRVQSMHVQSMHVQSIHTYIHTKFECIMRFLA